MNFRMSRRGLLGWLGAGSLLSPHTFGAAAQTGRGRDLYEALQEMPLADVHCHGMPALEFITEEMFLEELAMPAWQMDAYFTINGENLYEKWRRAEGSEKRDLDQKHGIQRQLDSMLADFRETAFAMYLVKEMAGFFKCKPTVRDVVAARNEYTKRSPWGYVNDLFAAVKLDDLYVTSMHSVWTTPAITVEQFAKGLKSRVHPIFTVNQLHRESLEAQVSFADLIRQHDEAATREIVKNRRVGFKSHVVTRAGADIPAMSDEEGERAWEATRKISAEEKTRRHPGALPWDSPDRKVYHYLTWRLCDIAYKLDVPFHIHIGDGGEGQGNLSRQFPYNLENVARWPVDYPQKPVKIVMVHGGYPHVDQAAYMAHIFPNVWYDMSWMNPIANRGLREKLISVFETAPLSKVMYGSDAYHLPEFYYVAGKWGRKYIASALGVLVQDGVLTLDEAIRAGRQILGENANRLHKVKAATGTASVGAEP
jgi:predicted TIM-barrel fold metal-dependent hydrolase